MAYAEATLVDSSELDAYNGAFWDLGFRWQWDRQTYREICGGATEEERVRGYITRHQPHLLVAYDADTLAKLIVDNKTRRQAAVEAARAAGRRAELSCTGLLEA
jgi:hypothetical protein